MASHIPEMSQRLPLTLKDSLQSPREVSVTDPNRRSINWKESSVTDPNGGGRGVGGLWGGWLYLLQEIDSLCNSANEKPSPHQILASLNGLLFKTTPPNFLPLLQKITFLSFVGLCLWFCHSLHTPNCNFFY